MISVVSSKPGEGMTFKTVSFQGSQITSSQRRQLAFQQQVRAAFLNEHLQETVKKAEQNMADHKASGGKPERVWTVEYSSKGIPFLGDVFGF